MSMNVYNIVWADDEIDDFLDKDYEDDLREFGFKIIGKAHDGLELEKILEKSYMVDAVIVDANFNESSFVTESERDISGLDYARGLYIHKFNRSIPFYLYTNRTEELLRDITKNNPSYLMDFPRHERWFAKYLLEERNEMLEAIKNEVDKRNTTSFKVRNRYQYELNAATLIDGAHDLVYEILERNEDGTLQDMVEPFVRIRRTIEKMFSWCEKMKLIPPISQDTNGTTRYFLTEEYSRKEGSNTVSYYKMTNEEVIMSKPLAQSLDYITRITQDGSHSKDGLKLDVDKYFERTKDVLLLKSVGFIIVDLLTWFARFMLNHQDLNKNEETLWEKI